MVKPAVGMSERKHELRCDHLASEPDHNAVDRPLTLHLYPVSTAPSDVRAIRPLRDHPFDVGQGQPRMRKFDLVRLINQLQAWIVALEQAREFASTDCQWLCH